MKSPSATLLSVVCTVIVACVIAVMAFGVLGSMTAESRRVQDLSDIADKTHALHVLTASFMEASAPREVRQIQQILHSLDSMLLSVSPRAPSEAVLLEQLRRSFLRVGPLINQWAEPATGGIEGERRNIIAAQIWMKLQFISDDIQRLKNISQARIVMAQKKTAVIVVALIIVLAVTNGLIYWLSVRSIVRVQRTLRERDERVTAELQELVQRRTAKLQETIGELESFSYSIVHDMRAPLRSMQSFAQLLAEECGPLSPTATKYVERIMNGARRMDRLIQDVLSYSKVVRSEFPREKIDVGQLLRGILDSYQQFQAPHAEIRLEGGFPVVLANEAALTQCISNLLGNAVKFVAPGVTPQVRVWAETNELRLRLLFQDNGIGIEKVAHKKIFQIFQRLSKSYEGTGIGLAIVERAVRRMGGSVDLESEPGKGSTFWLELALASEERPAPVIDQSEPQQSHQPVEEEARR